MCGIAGFWFPNNGGLTDAELAHVDLIKKSIKHRGPDSNGHWFDKKNQICLIHQRLAVQDLSKAGSQPMISPSSRWRAIFNGEIYNHFHLREALETEGRSSTWKSMSDTETFLNCMDFWGLEKTLNMIEGMFSLAIWDSEKSSLILTRDRFGEKPLYYGWQRGRFYFGSELKAIRACPHFSPKLNFHATRLFFKYNYVPAPHSIYEQIFKMPAGAYLEVFANSEFEINPFLSPKRYWTVCEKVIKSEVAQFQGSDCKAVQKLNTLLEDSVSAQSISDVAVGSFLSGGVDSTLVTSILQSQKSCKIDSFTIGFEDRKFNEADYANAVAKQIGCNHTTLFMSGDDALGVVDDLSLIYDEPFADSSQIPTLALARLAKQSITVALSGDGADELFGGYNRHVWIPKVSRMTGLLPDVVCESLAMVLMSVPPHFWDTVMNGCLRGLGVKEPDHRWGEHIKKIASIINLRSPESMYNRLTAQWFRPELVVPSLTTFSDDSMKLNPMEGIQGHSERMMALDCARYLPDDLLVKLDRAAMSCSLETRLPFLDQKLAEFAWSLPMEMKVRGKTNKWVLRQLLEKRLPRQLVNRPKMGFGVPLGDWLRGPLKGLCEVFFSKKEIIDEGVLDAQAIQEKWNSHLSGRADNSHQLWAVLMFRLWLKNNKEVAF